MFATLFTLALAPVLFMMHFVYVRDKYEREPLRRLLLVFVLSFFTIIPAAIFESMYMLESKASLWHIAFDVWLIVALSEELVKFLAVSYLAYRHASFNEVYDGILYAVAASLGFATIENLMYVMFAGPEGLSVTIMRAIFAVPAHALWGVMLGYYIGHAKFAATRQQRLRLILQGLGIAIFWHGLYDFFAFGTEVVSDAMLGAFVLGLIFVVLSNWIIAVRYIRRAQHASVFKRPPPMINPVSALNRRAKFCHQCGAAQPVEHAFCTRCGYAFPGDSLPAAGAEAGS